MMPPPDGDTWVGLTADPVPVNEASDWVVLPHCGGVVTFNGVARDHSDGRPGVSALEYEAYVDAQFTGTFSLAFDEAQPYTHKSQYLRGARLTGDSDAGLTGNALDNTLRGNRGDNALDGGAGSDTAIYCGAQSEYVVTTDGAVTTVSGPDGTDVLTNVEAIAFIDGLVEL